MKREKEERGVEWVLSEGDSSSSSSSVRWRKGTGPKRWGGMLGYKTVARCQSKGGREPKPFVGW